MLETGEAAYLSVLKKKKAYVSNFIQSESVKYLINGVEVIHIKTFQVVVLQTSIKKTKTWKTLQKQW